MSGVTNEEDKKPVGDQGAHINLKVKGQVRVYLLVLCHYDYLLRSLSRKFQKKIDHLVTITC